MVAGRDVVEDPSTGSDGERRAAVFAAAHEHVVDVSERPVGIGDERILTRAEGRRGLVGMDAPPGVAVADAESVQRLATGPEPQACSDRIGIEVARHHGVAGQLFEATRGLDGLALALQLLLRLPARKVVEEAQALFDSGHVDKSRSASCTESRRRAQSHPSPAPRRPRTAIGSRSICPHRCWSAARVDDVEALGEDLHVPGRRHRLRPAACSAARAGASARNPRTSRSRATRPFALAAPYVRASRQALEAGTEPDTKGLQMQAFQWAILGSNQ